VVGLAEWKRGDTGAAVRVLESVEKDWAQVEAQFQVVYVGIMGAAGQREAARVIARRVDSKGLAREEKALLQPWL